MPQLVGAMLLLLLWTTGFAQSTKRQPATEPATAPATIVGATPLEALQALLDSVEIGNPQVARQLLHADDESSAALAAAVENFAAAVAQLREAAKDRFGEESLAHLRVNIVGERTTIEGRVVEERLIPDPLKDAVVTIVEDVATIKFGEDSEDVLIMRRIDGTWKLSIAEVLSAPNRPPANAMQEAFMTVSTRLAELAEQVRGGTIDDLEELVIAVEKAVHRST